MSRNFITHVVSICLVGISPALAQAFTSESYTIDGYRIDAAQSEVMYSEQYSIAGVTIDPLPEAEEEDPEESSTPVSRARGSGKSGRLAYTATATPFISEDVATLPSSLNEKLSENTVTSPTVLQEENNESKMVEREVSNGSPSRSSVNQVSEASQLASLGSVGNISFPERLTVFLLVVLLLFSLKRYTVLGKKWLPF